MVTEEELNAMNASQPLVPLPIERVASGEDG
jgi:hypothetical protein